MCFLVYVCARRYFKVAKLEKELKQAEKARALSESLVQDFQGKLNAAEAARRRLEDENKVCCSIYVYDSFIRMHCFFFCFLQ